MKNTLKRKIIVAGIIVLFMMLNLIGVLLVSVFLLGETLTLTQWIGAAFSILAIFLV